MSCPCRPTPPPCAGRRRLQAGEPYWVTSKLWLTNFGAAHVRPALEETLHSLQLASRGLDLYIMHAPVGLRHVGAVVERRSHELLGVRASSPTNASPD